MGGGGGGGGGGAMRNEEEELSGFAEQYTYCLAILTGDALSSSLSCPTLPRSC